MADLYAPQAATYDDFRRRSLPGRERMCQLLDLRDDAVWVDFGGGTGANLEFVAERISMLRSVYVVDVAQPMLDAAQRRCDQHGWRNVQCIQADAATFQPDDPADVVTFSYSLSMMPDWLASLGNAKEVLRPGGQIGVVDFYVSRKYASAEMAQHGWWTRTYWPMWFVQHQVMVSSDHLPALEHYFQQQELLEDRIRLPYMVNRAPYYIFVGRKTPY